MKRGWLPVMEQGNLPRQQDEVREERVNCCLGLVHFKPLRHDIILVANHPCTLNSRC